MLRKRTLQAIREHAMAEYPRECCGLVVMGGRGARGERYYACKNIAPGTDNFKMCPQDYANASDAGRVVAVVHSHPDVPDAPSEGDKAACEASILPWYIINVTAEGAALTINRIEPQGYVAPLIGRTFAHGTLDCYTLVRDFYQRELGIELMDFERADNWWNDGQDLYMDNYVKAGFIRVEDGSLKFGDMILMQIGSPVANHAGVFIGAVDMLDGEPIFPVHNGFIHHLYGYSSQHVIYGGMWAQSTIAVMRHQTMIEKEQLKVKHDNVRFKQPR